MRGEAVNGRQMSNLAGESEWVGEMNRGRLFDGTRKSKGIPAQSKSREVGISRQKKAWALRGRLQPDASDDGSRRRRLGWPPQALPGRALRRTKRGDDDVDRRTCPSLRPPLFIPAITIHYGRLQSFGLLLPEYLTPAEDWALPRCPI